MTENVLAPSVAAVTEQLMARLDERVPGRLEALYLVGSIALGDYRPGHSDIDFVAVLAGEPDLAELAAVHAALGEEFPDVHCDGIYLRPGELSAPPSGTGPEARAGGVALHSGGERHAVTWLTMAQAGVALRGPEPSSRWILSDRAAAIRHSQQNLQSYWRNWLEDRRKLLSAAGPALLRPDAVTWGVLGIARVNALIATGQVLSKSGAGEYALQAFPAHARIVHEALRLRQGLPGRSSYRMPIARRRDIIAFMDSVLSDPGAA
jgi:hypothetical protein